MLVTCEDWKHRKVPASGVVWAPKDWGGKKLVAVINMDEANITFSHGKPPYTVETINGAVLTFKLGETTRASMPVNIGTDYAGADVLLLLDAKELE